MDHLELVKQYHQQTKHNFNRYSRSLGYMDWANQPDPFRRYEGAALHHLPILTVEDEPRSPRYADLFQPLAISAQPLTLNSLSRFFEYALSITAWKEYGENRWALRSNPSSGNLHPTEGYILIGEIPNLPLSSGLHHYAPKEHAFEHRLECSKEELRLLLAPFPVKTFLVGLSSVHWRESWKYGERAFRYCQHDIGHAIGALRIAAASLGWKMILLTGLADQDIAQLLGLNRRQDFLDTEPEFPELLAAIIPHSLSKSAPLPLNLEGTVVQTCVLGHWTGKANRLSRDSPIPWEIINEVTRATTKQTHQVETLPFIPGTGVSGFHLPLDTPEISANQVIHQRRSAVALDGQASISAAQFFSMLGRIFPWSDVPVTQRPMPWDTLPWNPTIHLAIFVHRVDDMLPGLYLLLRRVDEDLRSTLQSLMHSQFVWTTPPGCPESLPLYLLEDGNVQNLATQLSCGQEIAGQGAFALGMIAEFNWALERYGSWFYKRLFWEAGVIGQVLYLEAESAGVRATGIGCFFDDPVHQVLGFPSDTQFQTLYHFTVGGPVEDHRLTTIEPYGDQRT